MVKLHIFKDNSLQVCCPHRKWIKHWVVNRCRVIRLFCRYLPHHCELFSVYICDVCPPQYLVVFSPIIAVHLAHSIFSHVLLVIIHKPGKQVSTLKAYAIMRLSSFTYRITTLDWFPTLIKLHFRYAYDVW